MPAKILYDFLVKYNALEAFLGVENPGWFRSRHFKDYIDNCVDYSKSHELIVKHGVKVSGWGILSTLFHEHTAVLGCANIIPDWKKHGDVKNALLEFKNPRTQLLRRLNAK